MLKTITNIVNVSQIVGVLPVANGGTGVTTSTGTGSTVLSAAPTLSGNVTLSTGNLIVASGQGIDFSATPGTGTSELLSDYEEGAWTPALTAGSGSITSFTATGVYTKIGRQVTATCAATLTDNGTGGLFIRIAGLPFVPSATTTAYGANDSVGTMLKGAITAASDIYLQTFNALYPASTGNVILVTAIYFV